MRAKNNITTYVITTLIITTLFSFQTIHQLPILSFLKTGVNLICASIHQIGHTLTFWLFGYPIFPSIELEYNNIAITQKATQYHLQHLLVTTFVFIYLYTQKALMTHHYIKIAITLVIINIIAFLTFHKAIILLSGHIFESIFGGTLILISLLNILENQHVGRASCLLLGFHLNISIIKETIDTLINQDQSQLLQIHHTDLTQAAKITYLSPTIISIILIITCILSLIIPFILAPKGQTRSKNYLTKQELFLKKVKESKNIY